MGILFEYRRTMVRCQSITENTIRSVVRTSLRVVMMAAFLVLVMHGNSVLAAQTGKDFHQTAVKALQGGDAAKAVEFFTKALEANPREYRYYNDRGIAYRREGKLQPALADYTKALELKPDYTNALNNRGIVYLQQGEYNSAAADFTEALKHGGLEGKIYTNRGIARASGGDHKGAIEDFEKALSFPPVDTRSFLLMAKSLEEVGAKDKALKMYQLAKGLVKDREKAARIEAKITELEPNKSAAQGTTGEKSTRRAGSSDRNAGPTSSVADGEVRKTVQSRIILPAAPPPKGGTGTQKASQPVQDTRVESIKDLNGQLRKMAGEKYSPVARDIFRQGLQFLEKSDANKALVRFEDARQLERRQKNYYAVAWSDLEIGRSYAAMNEYLKAAPYLEEALRLFERLKSSDELVLTLVESAQVTKAVGRTDRSAELYRSAIEKTSASGHYALSRIIGDMAAGRPIQPKVTKSEEVQSHGKGSGTDSGSEKTVSAALQGTSGLADQPHRAGRKALQWGKKETQAQTVPKSVAGKTPQPSVRQTDEESQSARIILWAKNPSDSKKLPAEKKEERSPHAPETMVGTAPGAGLRASASGTTHPRGPVAIPATGTIQQDLQLLRDLKSKNAESEMIAVLERLADNYTRIREFDKALYSLSASLSLREKLLVAKGHDKALVHAAVIKEQLGRWAEALEDMTRALVLARSKREKTEKELEARSKKLAAALGLDSAKALTGFANLWKARNEGKGPEETEALHFIGSLFEAAERPVDALKYFDRSAASMLADKARVYRKAGKTQDAERLHEQALKTFKELDYGRYMQLMKESKRPNTVSQH